MSSFNIRRMLQFSRLQLSEIYLARPWRSISALSAAILILCIASIIFESQSIHESLDLTESMFIALCLSLQSALYGNLTNNFGVISRNMIPASNAEKYTGMLAGAAVATIICLVSCIVIGSLIYNIAGLLIYPGQNEGIVIIYFRGGTEFLSALWFSTIICSYLVWGTPFIARRKSCNQLFYWSYLAIFLLLHLIPICLCIAGYIPEEAGDILLFCITSVLSVISFIWGYRFFRTTEYKKAGNDIFTV